MACALRKEGSQRPSRKLLFAFSRGSYRDIILRLLQGLEKDAIYACARYGSSDWNSRIESPRVACRGEGGAGSLAEVEESLQGCLLNDVFGVLVYKDMSGYRWGPGTTGYGKVHMALRPGMLGLLDMNIHDWI